MKPKGPESRNSKVKKVKPNPSAPEKNSVALLSSRRYFLMAIMSILAAAGYGYKKLTEENSQTLEPLLNQEREIEMQGYGEKMPLPEFRIGERYELNSDPPPHGVDGISAEDSARIFNDIKIFLQTKLPRNMEEMEFLINQIFTSLRLDKNPKIKQRFESFIKEKNTNALLVQDHINEYLIGNGKYFHLICSQIENHFSANLYDITAVRQVEVEMDHQSDRQKFTILYAQNPVFPVERKKAIDTARASVSKDYAVFFADQFQESLVEVFGDLSSNNVSPGQRQELERAWQNETLIHEVTHLLMAKKFPKTCRPSNILDKYQFGIPMKVGKTILNLDGPFDHLMFQEMAAVGTQLANSSLSFTAPLSLHNFAGPVPDQSTYFMVNRLLPVIILANGPKNKRRNEILSRIETTRQIDLESLQIYTRENDFTLQHSHKAGEHLYHLAFSLFSRFENKSE